TGESDGSVDPGGIEVVAMLDHHLRVDRFERPFLPVRVHAHGGIGATTQGSGQQLVRGETKVLTTVLLRLIRDQCMGSGTDLRAVMVTADVCINGMGHVRDLIGSGMKVAIAARGS